MYLSLMMILKEKRKQKQQGRIRNSVNFLFSADTYHQFMRIILTC